MRWFHTSLFTCCILVLLGLISLNCRGPKGSTSSRDARDMVLWVTAETHDGDFTEESTKTARAGANDFCRVSTNKPVASVMLRCTL
jgi:hypothetical protein